MRDYRNQAYAEQPMVAQVFNPELYTSSSNWTHVPGVLKSTVRGAIKVIPDIATATQKMPYTVFRATDALFNSDRPEYQGLGFSGRFAKARNVNTFFNSSRLPFKPMSDGADRLNSSIDRALDKVPVLNNSELRNSSDPYERFAAGLSESAGNILGGIGLSAGVNAVKGTVTGGKAMATGTQTATKGGTLGKIWSTSKNVYDTGDTLMSDARHTMDTVNPSFMPKLINGGLNFMSNLGQKGIQLFKQYGGTVKNLNNGQKAVTKPLLGSVKYTQTR